ncbi:MAG: 4Fe-4S binding protein [Firmicutes bacterium]|nr:4Fe-4S binding protein [Bacillota bacterium]
MATRKIIKIDEEKCDGCGLCLPACPEGALAVVDGKARLVKESYCDGLGACLGECPKGALTIEEREAEEYDAEGVIAHLRRQSPELLARHLEHLRAHGLEAPAAAGPESGGGITCSCQELAWGPAEVPEEAGSREAGRGDVRSELRQWPVQLHLVSPAAPYFKNADLLVAADCVPVACAGFHRDFLRGRAVVVGCPKFDDVTAYREKLRRIFLEARPRSVLVAYMEVPCCYGLVYLVKEALAAAGRDLPVERVVIGVKGEVKERRREEPAERGTRAACGG